jgi:hypothetical protein
MAVKILAEFRTRFEMDSNGSENLEEIEQGAWEMFQRVQIDDMEWDLVVSKYETDMLH